MFVSLYLILEHHREKPFRSIKTSFIFLEIALCLETSPLPLNRKTTMGAASSSYYNGGDLHGFFNNDLFSDIGFIVSDKCGNPKRIPAHRVVLAALSQVFRQLLWHEIDENANIHITDVTAESFAEFLQLFYKPRENNLILTIENIAEVMHLIDKYDASSTRDIIDAFLSVTVSTDNVCLYYELSARYSDWHSNIEDYLKIICDNSKLVFESASFLELSEMNLINILQSDKLNCNEITVFNAAVAWINNSLSTDPITKENFNAAAKNIIKYIRFPIMNLEEFLSVIKSFPTLMKFDVYMDIISHIGTQTTLTAGSHFSTRRRLNETGPNL